jgi:ABC-type phosphonate transport system ATPase subunit
MTSLAPTNGRDYAPAQNDQPLLRFEHVTKQFGGTLAVNDVTFDLFSHEVLPQLTSVSARTNTNSPRFS